MGYGYLKSNEAKLSQIPYTKRFRLTFILASGSNPDVFGKSRHPLTAPKRQFSAAWELPRKTKNLRPCVAHLFVLHKVFFLLILSLQITQLPLLSSPSGHEQTQKRYPFFSGQTPSLPHYIIVSTPQTGRVIPVFFSSRFQREKDRVKKRPCNFLEILQTFLHIFLLISFISHVISFSPYFRGTREKKIWKKKEPYRASQSLIAASFVSSYDTRKNEMGARSKEGKGRKW